MKPEIGVLTLGEQYSKTKEDVISRIMSGTLHAKKRIAGIPCPDKESTEQLLGFYTKENNEMMQIRNDLEKANLPFKAIIPTDFYNDIKIKKEVYTFTNIDQEGYARISNSSVSDFIKESHNKFKKRVSLISALIIAITIAASTIIGECLVHSYSRGSLTELWNTFWNYNPSGWWIAFIVAGFLEGYLIEAGINFLYYRFSIHHRIIIRNMSKRSHKILWPEYTDKNFVGHTVKIDFIEPPESVVQNVSLWKESNHTIHISAQKEAFTLDINPLRFYLNQVINSKIKADKRQEEIKLQARIEAQRKFWQRVDPLISTEIGEYTVLIDAYGGKSFISEAEVMSSVTEYYNSKLQEFQTILN